MTTYLLPRSARAATTPSEREPTRSTASHLSCYLLIAGQQAKPDNETTRKRKLVALREEMFPGFRYGSRGIPRQGVSLVVSGSMSSGLR